MVLFAFKGELAIVINNHGEAVTIDVVSEANEAVVFEVRTHRRIAVIFQLYCAVIAEEGAPLGYQPLRRLAALFGNQ